MSGQRSIALSAIRIDGGTQPREAIDEATVDEYAEAMRKLSRFPPLVTYHDGVDTWLADGFHRYLAAKRIEASALEVDWRVGTLESAKIYAACANRTHGLRRTAGDKRRAVEMVLSTAEGRKWTQDQIAKHCDVARSWVSEIIAQRRSDNPPQNPPPPKLTKTEQKRLDIAAAISATPTVSDRAIGRQLGVDRETVAAVRATARGGCPAVDGGATPSPMPAPSAGGFSTGAAGASAHTIVDAMHASPRVAGALGAACASFTDDDWQLLLTKIRGTQWTA